MAGLGFPRWVFLDELNKYRALLAMIRYLLTLVSEFRHRRIGISVAAQRVDETVKKLLPLASIVSVGKMMSLDEVRALQRVRQTFVRLPAELVGQQEAGHIYTEALRSNEPIFTQTPQGVWVRPTCVTAGGESKEV